ncbi:MAG: hypothetical protein JO026_00450, partial [Patescibacteria group bacterium]|nr:hypothetical protein [Patescibacteria group bacterium]
MRRESVTGKRLPRSEVLAATIAVFLSAMAAPNHAEAAQDSSVEDADTPERDGSRILSWLMGGGLAADYRRLAKITALKRYLIRIGNARAVQAKNGSDPLSMLGNREIEVLSEADTMSEQTIARTANELMARASIKDRESDEERALRLRLKTALRNETYAPAVSCNADAEALYREAGSPRLYLASRIPPWLVIELQEAAHLSYRNIDDIPEFVYSIPLRTIFMDPSINRDEAYARLATAEKMMQSSRTSAISRSNVL